ncbi:MAG: substrate-binding domain-containing protein [Eubacteriales bacterium]|nr:substrate-binding domain-containing protein [Eubacteriales bacterium]
MKKRGNLNKEILLMILTICMAMVFIFLISAYYGEIMEDVGASADEMNQVYDHQYELIVDSRNQTFWEDVYENARKEALENGAVLEMKGTESGGDHSKADYLDMSIDAQVDGIILEYNGEKDIEEKIDEAVRKGIPVVTIVNDATKSLRQSFVGINDYQLGQAYGAQVANLIDENTEKVLVLLNRETDLGQNQLYAQIHSAIEDKLEGRQIIRIQSRNIMSQSQFDTEEEIRSIFQGEEGPPQILVCLDEVTTECAYQAMIDYNMVGDVKIIGYYTSKTIMDGVKKGLIPVTLTMDVEQIGAYSIEALTEYHKVGRTNSYYTVDLDVITEENWQEG